MKDCNQKSESVFVKDLKSIDNYFGHLEKPKLKEGFEDIIDIEHMVLNCYSQKHQQLLMEWSS